MSIFFFKCTENFWCCLDTNNILSKHIFHEIFVSDLTKTCKSKILSEHIHSKSQISVRTDLLKSTMCYFSVGTHDILIFNDAFCISRMNYPVFVKVMDFQQLKILAPLMCESEEYSEKTRITTPQHNRDPKAKGTDT